MLLGLELMDNIIYLRNNLSDWISNGKVLSQTKTR